PFHRFSVKPTPTTHTYPLSLHDALPISRRAPRYSTPPHTALTNKEERGQSKEQKEHPGWDKRALACITFPGKRLHEVQPNDSPKDRKSTRLNSSHVKISYAVFCLKKKRK